MELKLKQFLVIFIFGRMESAYRMWTREKREGSKPEDLDQLSRELQTALGTAKWQVYFVLQTSKFITCLS
jgi:hypothetical protein